MAFSIDDRQRACDNMPASADIYPLSIYFLTTLSGCRLFFTGPPCASLIETHRHDLARLQNTLSGSILGAAACGACRRRAVGLLLRHNRHVLGGHRRIHALGRAPVATGRLPPGDLGLLSVDPP